MGLQIMSKGFNQSEANHEGVSVEEIPCSERAAHSRSDGSPYEPYGDYNSRQCDHKYLVECFSQLHDIMYATLSHSHLLLVLLSWLNGADWKIDDEPNLSKLLNPDGTFNTAAVAAYGNQPPRKCVGCGTPSEGVWECGWCIRPLCSVHCARAHDPLCRNRDPSELTALSVQHSQPTARWFSGWQREYGLSMRKPNRKYKVPKAVMAERLEIGWLNVARIRALCLAEFGYDPEIENWDQSPFHHNESGSQNMPTLAVAGNGAIVPLIEGHSATRERWTAAATGAAVGGA